MVETICAVSIQLVESDEENDGSGRRTTTDISFGPSCTVERSEVSTAEGATAFVMDNEREENGAFSLASLETTHVPPEVQNSRANFKVSHGFKELDLAPDKARNRSIKGVNTAIDLYEVKVIRLLLGKRRRG